MESVWTPALKLTLTVCLETLQMLGGYQEVQTQFYVLKGLTVYWILIRDQNTWEQISSLTKERKRRGGGGVIKKMY